MKAEELMKGDWVTSEDLLNRPARYEGRYEDYTPINGKPYRRLVCLWPGDKEGASVPEDRVLPVPLTPEILEKNGFGKDKNGDLVLIEEDYAVRVMRRGDVYAFTLVTARGGITDMVRFTIHQIGPFSVHWVQHALRLCGIDKEITL